MTSDDLNYNEDWERENDIQDGKQYGRDCSGCYCLNCDFFSSCSKEIKYSSLI